MNYLFTAWWLWVAPVAPLLLLVITHNKGCAREDQQGQKTNTPGETKNEIVWDAGNINAGVYFYRLTAGKKTVTGKLVKI